MSENHPFSDEVIDLAWEAANRANRIFDVLQDLKMQSRNLQPDDNANVNPQDAVTNLDKQTIGANRSFSALTQMAGVIMYQGPDGQPEASPWWSLQGNQS